MGFIFWVHTKNMAFESLSNEKGVMGIVATLSSSALQDPAFLLHLLSFTTAKQGCVPPHVTCDIATALFPLLLWKTGYLPPLREGSELWQLPRTDPNHSLLWWDNRSSSSELSIANLHPIVSCSSCSSSPIVGAAQLQPLIGYDSC